MATVNNILGLGKRALLAQQGSLAAGGDNVANVNTPGYARRRAELAPAPTDRSAFGGLGSGVEIVGVRGLRDAFVERALHRAKGESARYDLHQEHLQAIETVLGDLDETGLSGVLNRFWNAWNDLALEPDSTSARLVLREAAQSVVNAFRSRRQELDWRQRQIDAEITSRTAEVNRLCAELAELNRQMARSSTPAAALEDRRTQVLDRLAELLNLQYHLADNGSVSVFTGGTALVMGDRAAALKIFADASGQVQVHLADMEGALEISGGEIGALFEVRDADLAGLVGRLDALAAALAAEVNRVHRRGYSQDGSTGNDFFHPETTGAGDLALSDAVTADPAKIAASADGLPGDNRLALEIAALSTAPVLSAGRSLSQELQDTLSAYGERVAQVRAQAEAAELSLQQMKSWREAASGVSLDEEMAELVRFQQAFNAAAKVVGAADTMMQNILAMVK